jgi:hypothetical protein
MFSVVMLIPFVLILGGVAYSVLYIRNMKARIASDGPKKVFHDEWAVYFDEPRAGETIVEVWQGEQYAGALNGTELSSGDRAERLAATVGAAALGMGLEYFRPLVYVGRTSLGRLLVAEEYAEGGDRGNYRQVVVYDRPRALADAEAYAGRRAEAPPANKTNPKAPLVFVELRGADGEPPYALWAPQSSYAVAANTGRSLRAAFPPSA